jgi:NADH dehydrogenase
VSREADIRPPRIVIIGGGFAGVYCAQELERRLRPDEAEVVLVDRNNYFIFYPLLVEAGTGSLEPRHAVVSIRSFIDRTRFMMGSVIGGDLDAGTLRIARPDGESETVLEFDHLVVAPGSITRLPPVPGLKDHGFEIKSLNDAVTLRDRAIGLLEQADCAPDAETRRRLLHFVVVGANFTGVEIAGEMGIFLHRAAKQFRNIKPSDIRVSMVELGQRILPALDEDLSSYAHKHLMRRGMDIRLGTSVSEVEAGSAVLSTGERLDTETVIWCAGIAPSPVIDTLALPTDAAGYAVCDRDLRVHGRDTVWAIGDSAVNLDANGEPYPATAQHATRQGAHAAQNIVRALRGEQTRPCDIVNRGAIAALGCRTGVAKVFGLRVSGFPAWFLFRTVYLMKMPGLARKVRVALDWTIDLLFAKDTVQLGLTGRAGRAGALELGESRRAA